MDTFLKPVDTIRVLQGGPQNTQLNSEIYASCREISSQTNTLNNELNILNDDQQFV